MLLLRIRKQEKSSLARQVFDESRAKGWPGLGEEVTEICEEIGIPDVNEVEVSKQAVNDAIWNHHYDDIKKELSNSKKLKDIKEEDFTKVQDYFKDISVEHTKSAVKW